MPPCTSTDTDAKVNLIKYFCQICCSVTQSASFVLMMYNDINDDVLLYNKQNIDMFKNILVIDIQIYIIHITGYVFWSFTCVIVKTCTFTTHRAPQGKQGIIRLAHLMCDIMLWTWASRLYWQLSEFKARSPFKTSAIWKRLVSALRHGYVIRM